MLTTPPIALFLFSNVPPDYFLVYIADGFYIVSSRLEMPATPIPELWMAVKNNINALFPFSRDTRLDIMFLGGMDIYICT